VSLYGKDKVTTSASTSNALPLGEVVTRIVTLNTGLRDFWSKSHGWAPNDAADLLSRSRLDWQVSLSLSLRRWIDPPSPDDEAAVQILAYANLGALVEGTLKLFLGVFYNDYRQDADAVTKKSTVQDPDGLTLEPLRQFFKDKIWVSTATDNWDPWIQRIQSRRNAIHAFKDRDIGTHSDVTTDIRRYLTFLRRINGQLPYPDDQYGPVESYDPTFRSYECDTDAPGV
jgi:hypothetical protein